MRSILRMKDERAAMTARCMVILSPATSNAKSNHGASSRLNGQSVMWKRIMQENPTEQARRRLYISLR